jgi:hypothetical protein
MVIVGVLWFLLAFVTGRLAASRGMSQWGGILFGWLLGPVALAVIWLMPGRSQGMH